MKYTVQEIQNIIKERLPAGRVITRHTEHGHFYEVDEVHNPDRTNPVYPSVTGKLQVLKDESLINYKKNQIIQWVFKNWKRITDANIMELLAEADRVPEDILADAGDVGTQIHDARQLIFEDWIATGVRPGDFLFFIPPGNVDVRVKSAIRALQTFCIEKGYRPIATELFVYSHSLRVAGTLDDIGMMPTVIRPGMNHNSAHQVVNRMNGATSCVECNYKMKWTFVLMDLKSSNQFKGHYFFQVSLYWEMLWRLIGIKPERCFILKLSKEDGTYKIEDLKFPAKIASYAKSMLRTNEGVDYVKSLRKDNQKVVGEKIEF